MIEAIAMGIFYILLVISALFVVVNIREIHEGIMSIMAEIGKCAAALIELLKIKK